MKLPRESFEHFKETMKETVLKGEEPLAWIAATNKDGFNVLYVMTGPGLDTSAHRADAAGRMGLMFGVDHGPAEAAAFASDTWYVARPMGETGPLGHQPKHDVNRKEALMFVIAEDLPEKLADDMMMDGIMSPYVRESYPNGKVTHFEPDDTTMKSVQGRLLVMFIEGTRFAHEHRDDPEFRKALEATGDKVQTFEEILADTPE